ncbi:YrrS family protein [Jeotgalibacillus soli]|uniref:DUF1510 domain-containing protein n=1 Tax=Jeotgalibacillus soli TaxID=889306 RepID=A0A0C2V684_9BACL|nr:YrrS family protein [Jeotgalibacillus soli]KIL44487.1 hypothetical protein KP78_34510 [Jeotgalibacillus soli]
MTQNQPSREKMYGQKRKTNVLLNSSIAVVLVLILIVSSMIFLNGATDNDSTVATDQQQGEQTNAQDKETDIDSDSVEESSSDRKEDDGTNEEEKALAASDEDNNDTSINDQNEQEDRADEEDNESNTAVTTAGTEPGVEEVTVNDGWKPIGTTQTGEHVSIYDESSVDWSEKVQAISYATGISEQEMTIWFIGNHEQHPQKSVGTVSPSNDASIKYRVYLEWVDQEGWKPVKMEKLTP